MARRILPLAMLILIVAASGCTEASSAAPEEPEEVRIKRAQDELKEIQRTGKQPSNG
jgi:hypothetical protein